jgi:beta-lactamase regulating signal transducer with metallopeptidase domain
MTTLGVAVLLGIVHTSIVALTTMIARVCISRRVAAGRAMVGVIGMACMLVVTGLALLPLPGVWPPASTLPVEDPASLNPRNEPAGLPNGTQRDTVALAATPDNAFAASEGTVNVPSAWLQRLGHGVRRATVAADESSRGWQGLALAVVLGGSALSLIRLLLATRAVQRLRRASSLIADASITTLVEKLKRRCDCHREIELRQADQLASAAACGWSRPVILLPKDWSQWSREELAAVLAHEVAHVHRADDIHRLVALVSAAVHFYHPLVRAAARCLAADQEFAADRLARGLAGDTQAYTRGLARLALRYHESFQDQRGWSSVSIMPRSSDFLARRLEMLRVKDVSTDKCATRFVSYGASSCLVAIALATAMLRGAAASDDNAQTTSPAVAETAPAHNEELAASTQTDAPTRDQDLFRRAAFDPAMIRPGTRGGFLIRVGDFLRHPEVQPHIDTLNKEYAEFLRLFIGDLADRVDVRDIEWMAGDLLLSAKPPEGLGGNAHFMLGTGGMVIRTTKPGNLQELIQEIPGSLLKSFEGKQYMELPVYPELGPAPLRMRFIDDHTIAYGIGTKEDGANADAEARFLRRFFDDTPRPRPWAKAWQAVDGGLITLAFDNSEVGWLDLPEHKRDCPPFVDPLISKTKYVAMGYDWTDNGNRTGVRLRATCPDQESVKEVHLATMTVLSYWPALFLEGGDSVAKYHKRILQFFSSVDVRPSAAESDEHFVHAMADVGWAPQEFIDILRQLWRWSSN